MLIDELIKGGNVRVLGTVFLEVLIQSVSLSNLNNTTKGLIVATIVFVRISERNGNLPSGARRHKGESTGVLDGVAKVVLMLLASTSDTTRQNHTLSVNIATEEVDIGVMDTVNTLRSGIGNAKGALLLTLVENIECLIENERILLVLGSNAGFETFRCAL